MDQSKAAASEQLNLPAGFRFHPTDEELVVHYLAKKAESRPFPIPIVAEVDLYKFDPWELPEKAYFGEKEWYFFSPRDRKYPNGARPNRAAGSGYWKATGTDKPVQSRAYNSHKVGVKKALVFYTGKAPKGIKTNWIMHEYRLADPAKPIAKKKGSLRLDDWVLCRIYKKSSSAFKVMVAAPCKPEPAEKELDDVLASLPDIDDHENRLPQFMNNPSFISNTGPMMEELFHEHDAKSLSSHMDNDYRVLLNNSAATPNSDFDAMMLKSFNNWTSDPQHNSTISSPTLLMLPNQQHMQMHMNGGGRMKRARIEDEDDVQSTCRSPIPRFQQQGFGMVDYSSQMQRLL